MMRTSNQPVYIQQMPREHMPQYNLVQTSDGMGPAYPLDATRQANMQVLTQSPMYQSNASDIYYNHQPDNQGSVHEQTGFQVLSPQSMTNSQLMYMQESQNLPAMYRPQSLMSQAQLQQQLSMNRASQQQQLTHQQQLFATGQSGLQQNTQTLINQQAAARQQAVQLQLEQQQKLMQENQRLMHQLSHQQQTQDHLYAARKQQLQAAQLQQMRDQMIGGGHMQTLQTLSDAEIMQLQQLRSAVSARSGDRHMMLPNQTAFAQSYSPSGLPVGNARSVAAYQNLRPAPMAAPQATEQIMLHPSSMQSLGQPTQMYHGVREQSLLEHGEAQRLQQATMLARDNADQAANGRKQQVFLLANLVAEQAHLGGSATQIINLAKSRGFTSVEIGFLVDTYIKERSRAHAGAVSRKQPQPMRVPTPPSPATSVQAMPPVLCMHSPSDSYGTPSLGSGSSRTSSGSIDLQKDAADATFHAKHLLPQQGEKAYINHPAQFGLISKLEVPLKNQLNVDDNNTVGETAGDGIVRQAAMPADGGRLPGAGIDSISIPEADVEWLKTAAQANKALWDGDALVDDCGSNDDLAACLANLDLGSGFL